MASISELPIEERVLATEDFYELLGINKDAEEKDIIKAYRKLALKLHPDRNKSPRAVPAFQKVERAHSALLDPQKRKLYDSKGHKAYDEFESRGGQEGPNFKEIITVFLTGEFFFTFRPATYKRATQHNKGPMSQAEERELKKHDLRILFIVAISILLGISIGMVDLDQRHAVASFNYDEVERYIFEETVAFNSASLGSKKQQDQQKASRSSRSSTSFAASKLGTLASNVKFYLRWKKETIGTDVADALVHQKVEPALESECLEEHRTALAFLERRRLLAEEQTTEVAAGPSSRSPVLDGRARFKIPTRFLRERKNPRRGSWKAWGNATTLAKGIETDYDLEEEEGGAAGMNTVMTASYPLSLSPQCIPPRMRAKKKVVRARSTT